MTAADEREVRDLIAVALAKLQAMGAMLDEQVVADAFLASTPSRSPRSC